MFSSGRRVWVGLTVLSFVVVGAALWFVALQVFVLRQFCPYCLVTHACALLGSVTILVLALGHQRTPRQHWVLSGAAALAALTLLVGGQLLFPHRLHAAAQPAVSSAPVVSLALAPGELVLVGGRVRFNASVYPALGSPAASHVVAVMFDYTCETCRADHALLAGVLARYGQELTIILIPTPLDPACNVAVERLRPEHVNACLYARYALAVWKAAPEKFAAYDAWLMAGGGTQPPPIEEARQRAEATVGAEAFQRALRVEEIERSLRAAGRMYQTLEAGVIPKWLLPQEVLVGGFASPENFDEALGKEFGIKAGQGLP